MADIAKKPTTEAPQHKIRLTLTSTNVKVLEKVTSDFLAKAQKRDIKSYGPIRMPTKTLRITTRKTPCGEGSKTWSRYQLRIHKRVIDLRSTTEIVREVTGVPIDPLVTVEVTVDDTIKNKLREQQESRVAPAGAAPVAVA